MIDSDRSVRLLAPAKLTVGLRVTGVREDGYHLIDAEMVSLDLYDELIVTSAGATKVSMQFGDEVVDAFDDDLVRAALDYCSRTANVHVIKRIPAGAGLGGGSSDAAAILHWGGVTDARDAVRLGADVSFCLDGGRARVSGIGEIIEPLPFVERTFTLFTPALHCSTPAVYRRWDEMGGPHGDHGNDLEPAAVSLYPELSEARDYLAAVSGHRPRLAGSGATWFVEGAVSGVGLTVVRTVSGRK